MEGRIDPGMSWLVFFVEMGLGRSSRVHKVCEKLETSLPLLMKWV